jgi:hypothetical protein
LTPVKTGDILTITTQHAGHPGTTAHKGKQQWRHKMNRTITLKIGVSTVESIRHGIPQGVHEVKIDAGRLTDEQRGAIELWSNDTVRNLALIPALLADDPTAIVAAQCDAAILKREQERSERYARNAAELADLQARVEAAEAGGDIPRYISGLGMDAAPEHRAAFEALQARVRVEQARRDAAKQAAEAAKQAAESAWDAKYLPLVEAHEAGEDRPSWAGDWGGSMALLERINKASRSLLAATKYSQMADVVNRLGTPTQRARWAEGVMPHSEAISLIEAEALKPLTDAGYEVLPADEYHLDPGTDEYGDDVDVEETEKRTLTNAQYEAAKKIRDLMPGWEYGYYQQYYSVDGKTTRAVYIRLSADVGVVHVCADVEIG